MRTNLVFEIIAFLTQTYERSLMDEKTFCVICDEDVEIVKVEPHGHYDEQILRCDHFGRKLNLSREDKESKTSLH
jgi:hypothetical protein